MGYLDWNLTTTYRYILMVRWGWKKINWDINMVNKQIHTM